MEDLMNAARREAERVGRGVSRPRLGTVSGYDPAAYAVKVMMQPEGAETGWLPLATLMAGNGWGIYAPPAIGDQVVVLFAEGSAEAGVVIGALYSDEDRPRSVASKNIELAHESGARLRLLPGGVVEVHGTDIKVGPEGGPLRRLVDERFMALFNLHTHDGPPPAQKMTLGGHFTAALKAG